MFKVFNNAMVLLAVCAFALASSGCGGGRAMTQSMPESLTTIDWLLPGEAGTTARDVFLVAASRGEAVNQNARRIQRMIASCGYLASTALPRKSGIIGTRCLLSSDIPKIQVRPAPGTYEFPGNDSRAVYGILDYGTFWIGSDVQPDGEYFGAGYDYLVDHRYTFPINGGQPEFLFPNAAWRGDALGMEKASGDPVWGPAALIMTSIGTSPTDGLTFNLHLDVAFLKNDGVDRVEIDTSGSDGVFGTDFSAGSGSRIGGTFLGPRAEEASGIFETLSYYGAFGLKR